MTIKIVSDGSVELRPITFFAVLVNDYSYSLPVAPCIMSVLTIGLVNGSVYPKDYKNILIDLVKRVQINDNFLTESQTK